MILSQEPVENTSFHWRKMGDKDFNELPVKHTARAVYQIELSTETISGDDFEYYITAAAGGDEAIYPATAPDICQSVVIF
jgi:hypothetical protein